MTQFEMLILLASVALAFVIIGLVEYLSGKLKRGLGGPPGPSPNTRNVAPNCPNRFQEGADVNQPGATHTKKMKPE